MHHSSQSRVIASTQRIPRRPDPDERLVPDELERELKPEPGRAGQCGWTITELEFIVESVTESFRDIPVPVAQALLIAGPGRAVH